MRRIQSHVLLLSLAITTAVLFYAGLSLRDSTAVQYDRQTRRNFAESVQRGESPRVAARNMGGVLRQEIDAQETAAAERANLAKLLQGAALLGVLGLGISALTLAPRRGGRPSPAAA